MILDPPASPETLRRCQQILNDHRNSTYVQHDGGIIGFLARERTGIDVMYVTQGYFNRFHPTNREWPRHTFHRIVTQPTLHSDWK